MIVKVPATSANVGCGFDSLGFAVNLFLEVHVIEEASVWQVDHNLGDDIPKDSSNLIVKTLLKIDETIKPRRLKVTNEVPLERGLGSSSTAIVAGIELASMLSSKELTLAEKLKIACEIEGHPDNVVPAILGGFVISHYDAGELSYVKIKPAEMGLVALVPNRKITTSSMREVLPIDLPYKNAVNASAISSTMIASLLTGDYIQAGKLIEKDLLHEPYRKKLLPEVEIVRDIAKNHDAYATYISGAGSTIMTLLPINNVKNLAEALSVIKDAKVFILEIENQGSAHKHEE